MSKWFEWLFLPRPRPLQVPAVLPTPEAVNPVEEPLPRDRDDGLPYMTIDAP